MNNLNKSILLMTPPFQNKGYRIGESFGLIYLATLLKEELFDVKIIEPSFLSWDNEKTLNYICKCDYKIIGISLQFDFTLDKTLNFINDLKIKMPNSHIFLGGVSATYHYKEILKQNDNISGIILYNGTSFTKICKSITENKEWHQIENLSYKNQSGEIIKNPVSNKSFHVDKFDYTIRNHYSEMNFSLLSSVGCLFSCSFCLVNSFYKKTYEEKWQYRSPEKIVDEIEYFHQQKKIQKFSFVDDNFIGSCEYGRKRAYKIAEIIEVRKLDLNWSMSCRVHDIKEPILRRLYEAGLRHVYLGIESGVKEILDRFNKKATVDDNKDAINTLKKLKIDADFYYIMFDPYLSFEELKYSIDFLREFEFATFRIISSKIMPYKGTSIYDKLVSDNNLICRGFVYDYNFKFQNTSRLYEAIKNYMKPLQMIDNKLSTIGYVGFISDNKTIKKLLDFKKIYSMFVLQQLDELIYNIENNEKIDCVCFEKIRKSCQEFVLKHM